MKQANANHTAATSLSVVAIASSLSRSGGGISQVVRDLSSEFFRQGLALETFALEDEHVGTDCAGVPFSYRLFARKGPSGFGYSPACTTP